MATLMQSRVKSRRTFQVDIIELSYLSVYLLCLHHVKSVYVAGSILINFGTEVCHLWTVVSPRLTSQDCIRITDRTQNVNK